MCFLKSIVKLQEFKSEPLNSYNCTKTLQNHLQSQFPYHGPFYSQHSNFLETISICKEFYLKQVIDQAFVKIRRNASQILNITKKLKQCEKNITKISQELSEYNQTPKMKDSECESTRNCPDVSQRQFGLESAKNITRMIFGKKVYQYRLQLVSNFPDTIYKERNIRLSVKLISLSGQPKKNENVINLYLSFCDNTGKWISKNRVGDPMIKGKTSNQLCSGQTEFNKLYPQDITRTYPDGKLNIIIYPKPLAVIYNYCQSTSTNSCFIDPESIQPLVIENIAIKAKKRTD